MFVALDNGRFEPRTVALGAREENDAYQVLSGLKEGERVVTSGQFMLDSESQLREAIQKMLSPQTSATPSPSPEVAQQIATVSSSAGPLPNGNATPAEYVSPTEYNCPMPEHMSIKYNHSGKCPICGMTLIPASEQKSAMPTPSPSTTATPHQHQP